MNVLVVRASAGSRPSLDVLVAGTLCNDRIAIVLCERGTVLSVPAGVALLACPIAGAAGIMNGEWSMDLRRADVCVGDAQSRHQLAVGQRGACLVVAGAPAAWAALGKHGSAGTQAPLVLFPAVHRAVRGICRRLLRIAHDGLRDGCAVGKHLERLLADLVDDLQSGFAAMVARCPGSSLTRKKAVFLRLQRVRNHIHACAHQEIDVARLALMANYSVGHFITTFRSVFDETPYSTVSRYRLESAGSLLSGSTLGIADIAQAIGFQSRSSFSRAIKKHFGSSATKFRESSARFGHARDELAVAGIAE